jgi:FKBP-type peptidyl-prolyl cis-trans isomerase FkpA
MTMRLSLPPLVLSLRVLVLAVALGASAACGGGGNGGPTSPTSPVVNVPYSQTDIIVGTGPAAANGNVLTVHYAGWLYNATAAEQKGALFDTSLTRGPFQFQLGAGQVIRGWDQGVAGMQVGGVRRLVLPPTLAYGSTGSGSIPPNATLVFEVELLAIQ